MKTETLLTVGALAVAAVLVLKVKRKAPAASSSGTASVGGAGAVWDDMATRRYRQQLGAELGSADFYV